MYFQTRTEADVHTTIQFCLLGSKYETGISFHVPVRKTSKTQTYRGPSCFDKVQVWRCGLTESETHDIARGHQIMWRGPCQENAGSKP